MHHLYPSFGDQKNGDQKKLFKIFLILIDFKEKS